MAAPVIQVTNLKKEYRSGVFRRRKIEALRGVSLEISAGHIYGLLGPNGAGKTTLIKILLGIAKKTSGDARVLGHPAGHIAARRRIGYLPENHRIPRHLTGQTALEYYGCLSGLALSEVRRRIPDVLRRVGLVGRERDRVTGYSKGMQQRLGLGQAMLHRPDLIVLDEPTDGVDPLGRKEIRDVLKELAADGATIFLNSHLLQEIELICEHVAILAGGRLMRTGRVSELKSALTGAAVVLRIRANRQQAEECFRGVDVSSVHDVGPDVLDVHAAFADQAQVDAVIDRLRAAGISILSLQPRERTLEDAFLQIVKDDSR